MNTKVLKYNQVLKSTYIGVTPIDGNLSYNYSVGNHSNIYLLFEDAIENNAIN